MPVSFFKKISSLLVAVGLLVCQTSWAKPETGIRDNDSLFELITADIALHRELPLEAHRLYNNTLKRTKDPRVASYAWQAALQTRNQELILKAAKEWVAIDPENEVPHQAILAHAIDNNQKTAFLKELSIIYRLVDDKAAWVARITNNLSRSNGNLIFIERGLSPYWEKEDANASVKIAIGNFKKRQGNYIEACRLGTDAYRLESRSEDIVTQAADLCWAKNPDTSRKMLEDFLSEKPSSATVSLVYSQVLARSGETKKAIAQIKRAVKASPEEPDVFLNAGLQAYELHALELARDYLSKYVELLYAINPDIDLSGNEIWIRLADIERELGNEKEELRYLASLTSGPQFPQVRVREAGILLKLGRLAEAEKILDTAGETYSDLRNYFLASKAQLLISAGQFEKALSIMEAELKTQPDNPELLYDTASIAANINKLQVAEKHLNRLLQIDPDHVQANNMLGYLFVDHGIRLREARRLLERAYRLSPLDPYVLDSMGWLCFKEGRYDQAAEFTMTSLKKMFDIEVAKHLLEILVRSERMDEAKSLYKNLIRQSSNRELIDFGKKLGLSNPQAEKEDGK